MAGAQGSAGIAPVDEWTTRCRPRRGGHASDVRERIFIIIFFRLARFFFLFFLVRGVAMRCSEPCARSHDVPMQRAR